MIHTAEQTSPKLKKGRKNLSSKQRKALFVYLQAHDNGKAKLPNGILGRAMELFKCSDRTVQRVWSTRKSIENAGEILSELSPKKKKKKKNTTVGAKVKHWMLKH
jgi:hypothetical protein